MLPERGMWQKTTYCVIPFIWKMECILLFLGNGDNKEWEMTVEDMNFFLRWWKCSHRTTCTYEILILCHSLCRLLVMSDGQDPNSEFKELTTWFWRTILPQTRAAKHYGDSVYTQVGCSELLLCRKLCLHYHLIKNLMQSKHLINGRWKNERGRAPGWLSH